MHVTSIKNSGVALYVFLRKPQKATYLLLRTAARLSSFHRKAKRLAFKAVLRCMGGDISAVVASPSRRPRTSMCLVKAGSRPVQIATPAFQSNPGLPRFHPRSSGVLSTIFDKIVGHLTLSPQANALVANLLTLNPPSSKLSGTCPLAKASLSRRQQFITRFARLNKQRSGDLSLFRSAPKS